MSPASRARMRSMGAAMLLACALGMPMVTAARAIDEIQVYNAGIAEVGQWTFQQHLNYTFAGRKEPDFPGGLISHHSLQGTPELAYGLAPWWEVGFYAPFAVTADGRFLSDAGKIRSLFVVPEAEKRAVFYGVNFEVSYQTPRFSQSRYQLEIRPIIGVRNKEWEFIVNPIVDLTAGRFGGVDLAPAMRLARNLGQDRFIGLEYYADFGQIGRIPSFDQQSHQIFLVTDFKVNPIDIELGVGYGLTSGSDRLVAKAIVGYAFPAAGEKDPSGKPALLGMASPFARQQLPPWSR